MNTYYLSLWVSPAFTSAFEVITQTETHNETELPFSRSVIVQFCARTEHTKLQIRVHTHLRVKATWEALSQAAREVLKN